MAAIRGFLTGDGPTVFGHVCNMSLEGVVSKRDIGSHHQGS